MAPSAVDMEYDYVLDLCRRMGTLLGSVGLRLWTAYNRSLATNPVLTKSFTSFTGFILGDGIAQIASKPLAQYDVKRTARFAAFGFCIHAPGCHFFYKALDAIIFPTVPKRYQLSFQSQNSCLLQRTLSITPKIKEKRSHQTRSTGYYWEPLDSLVRLSKPSHQNDSRSQLFERRQKARSFYAKVI